MSDCSIIKKVTSVILLALEQTEKSDDAKKCKDDHRSAQKARLFWMQKLIALDLIPRAELGTLVGECCYRSSVH